MSRGAWARQGDFFFRWRNAIFPVVLLSAVLVSRPAAWPDAPEARTAWRLLAVGIMLAGQALRAVTIGYEYIKRGGRDKKVWADTLVTGGVYAHTRNPMYAGNLLIAFGFAALAHDPRVYLTVLPATVYAYYCIIQAEERFLTAKFRDEFTRYRASVPCLWPNPLALVRLVAGRPADWAMILRKEYGTLAATAIGLVLLSARWSFQPFSWADPVYWRAVAPRLLLVCLAYAAARVAKKRGRALEFPI